MRHVASNPARLPRWPVLLLLASVPLVPGFRTGQDDPPVASGSSPEVLWHEATALFPIRVHLPEDFAPEQTYPVLLALHGFGDSSAGFGRVGEAFAEAGFIAVIPEGPYPLARAGPGRHSTWELSTWTEELGLGPPLTDDAAIEARSIQLTIDDFLPSVIERIRAQYPVGSVYVFGFSLGGVYALAGGFFNRDQIQGVVAFGAMFDRQWFTSRGDRLEDGEHLAVRIALGRSDPMVPFSHAERARDALEEAGWEVAIDAFEGGHTIPDDALARAVNWLRELADRR